MKRKNRKKFKKSSLKQHCTTAHTAKILIAHDPIGRVRLENDMASLL